MLKRSFRNSSWALFSAYVVAITAFVAEGFWIIGLLHLKSQISTQLTVTSTTSLALLPDDHIGKLQPTDDFTRRLPSSLDLQPLLDEIEQSCSRAGVRLGAVQISERVAATEQLQRAYLSLSLQGSYAKLKEVLAEVLGHFPNSTLAQLSMRRKVGATDVEATLSLALWGAPTSPIKSSMKVDELAPR